MNGSISIIFLRNPTLFFENVSLNTLVEEIIPVATGIQELGCWDCSLLMALFGNFGQSRF